MSVMPVRNNAALSCFELEAEGGTAVANYRLEDGVMTFFRTETPAHLQGRGIASQLVRGALDEARAKALKVKPRCSFVGQYMARHPETHDLLA
jgi:predicted GNAT family acetyltransferase